MVLYFFLIKVLSRNKVKSSTNVSNVNWEYLKVASLLKNNKWVKSKNKVELRISHFHKQLVVSIPRLSAPSYHLLGKINAMQTLNSTRRLCLLSKWLTIWTQLLQRVSMIIYNTKRLLIWQWLCGTVGKSVVLYNERTQLLRDKGKRLFVGYLRLAGEGSMSIGDPITITRVKWGVKNPSPLPKLKILVGIFY